MKKLYFLLLSFYLFQSLNAQVINFPDANFKARLLLSDFNNGIAQNNGLSVKIDINNDGEIEVSEVQNVKYLYIADAQISNLSGIENFTNLIGLDCKMNRLISFDLSNLSLLESLHCEYNLLESLTLMQSNVKHLNCDNNKLTSLNLSGLSNLISLNCSNNSLSLLDVQENNKLLYLDCNKNKISDLNLAGLSNLESLNCSENLLSNLNISESTKLKSIDCYINKLTTLNINKNLDLIFLDCSKNLITNLDLTGVSKLNSLFFSENQIEKINLNGLSELEYIEFFDNRITSIDFSSSLKITDIFGGKNPIETIDLSQLPNLEFFWLGYTPIHSLDLSNSNKLKGFNVSSCPNLESLNIKNGNIEDLSYLEAELLEYFKIDCSNFSNCPKLKYICGDEEELESITQKTAGYNYIDCIVGGYCSFNEGGANYTIQGNNRMDSDKNGCDASDLPVINLKFTFSDGIKTGNIITNNSGNYSIKVKEGVHIVTPILENVDYFTISPSSVNVIFPTDASPYIQDFCITPIDTHNDLEIAIIPLEMAIPGFYTKYKVIYKNKGNSSQSGTVNLTFDDVILDLIKAIPVTTIQTANNLSWNFSNLKPFETREITFILKVNSPMETPAVNNGDILKLTATIVSQGTDETPKDNIFTLNQTVVGSYDPNDKTCLEGTVITPSLIGEYVHYMIRFENTGTYPAKNIVVKDMIDLAKFDISTLIPTSSSHSFVTKISEGNKVEFIFENINLPFNDANNDGYVAFKIKTKPTLKVGDSFTNDANIYFDYNFPILTNKATSTFKTLGTQDFEFSNYFTLYPNPANQVLNINVTKYIEIQSLAIYDLLGQLVIAVPNAKTVSTIDVSRLKTGNYFIKVKSDLGSSSMKFIKK